MVQDIRFSSVDEELLRLDIPSVCEVSGQGVKKEYVSIILDKHTVIDLMAQLMYRCKCPKNEWLKLLELTEKSEKYWKGVN